MAPGKFGYFWVRLDALISLRGGKAMFGWKTAELWGSEKNAPIFLGPKKLRLPLGPARCADRFEMSEGYVLLRNGQVMDVLVKWSFLPKISQILLLSSFGWIIVFKTHSFFLFSSQGGWIQNVMRDSKDDDFSFMQRWSGEFFLGI